MFMQGDIIVLDILLVYALDYDFSRKDTYGFFAEPVDVKVVPDYPTVIKNPMDFGTMDRKIKGGEYSSIDEFAVRELAHL